MNPSSKLSPSPSETRQRSMSGTETTSSGACAARTVTQSLTSRVVVAPQTLRNPDSCSARSRTPRLIHDSNQSSTAAPRPSSARFLDRACVATSMAGHQTTQSLSSSRICSDRLTACPVIVGSPRLSSKLPRHRHQGIDIWPHSIGFRNPLICTSLQANQPRLVIDARSEVAGSVCTH